MTERANDNLADEARTSFAAGEYRRAWDAVQNALGTNPLDPALLRLAGRTAMELGKDEAVEYFQRAVALDPNDPDGWRELGDALPTTGARPKPGRRCTAPCACGPRTRPRS